MVGEKTSLYARSLLSGELSDLVRLVILESTQMLTNDSHLDLQLPVFASKMVLHECL